MIALEDMPAKVFRLDAPQMANGAPPNWGAEVVPHIYTVAGQAGLAGCAYLAADEALRHNVENAERMLADSAITECLEARRRAVALLNWHIEPEDAKDANQKTIAAELTKICSRIPWFMQMRDSLLQAVWYGRYGVAIRNASVEVGSKRRILPASWEPRHGDKLVFRYDDGSGKYEAGQVGIRISVAGTYQGNMLESLRDRKLIEYTGHGMVRWFDHNERRLLLVHKHMREDGPFHDVLSAGRIHGVGVRSKIYWTWYQMVEVIQRVLQFLDRAAFGVELWRYPANNPKAKEKTETAAKNAQSGGRSVVLVPVEPGENADLYGVEHVEPGLAGVDRLLTVVKEFFMHKIKRYVLGQTLTSEADATGMGSGVADAHMATFFDIVQYDAIGLEETLTTDLLRNLQLWNMPDTMRHYMRFKIDTKAPDVKDKLSGLKAAWDMGASLKATDLYDLLGLSMPSKLDIVLRNPQLAGAMESLGIGVNSPQVSPVGSSGASDPMFAAIKSAMQIPAHDAVPEVIHG